MKGKYSVIVQNKRLRYEFSIQRNITIIRGNSSTGKTTLIEMLSAYEREGVMSGTEVFCDCRCTVLDSPGWEERLSAIHGSLVFIDECHRFTASEEFAAEIRKSDNYYVIVAREGLPNLPYSVEEIYGIRSSEHYSGLKKTYHEFFRLYGDYSVLSSDISEILIEDSNAGYDFFSAIFSGKNCRSANGKSNIPGLLRETEGSMPSLVIADGAAFGCEMEKIERLRESGKHIILYLPESFEWLILSSGMIDGNRIRTILKNPEEYADSTEYFSWEQFFTSLLSSETAGTRFRYSKDKLNPIYLQKPQREKLQMSMPDALAVVSASSSV